MAEADDYLWGQDPRTTFLAVAGCVTIVRGSTRAAVLASFGADPRPHPRPSRPTTVRPRWSVVSDPETLADEAWDFLR